MTVDTTGIKLQQTQLDIIDQQMVYDTDQTNLAN